MNVGGILATIGGMIGGMIGLVIICLTVDTIRIIRVMEKIQSDPDKGRH